MAIRFSSVRIDTERLGEHVADTLHVLHEPIPKPSETHLFGPVPIFELTPYESTNKTWEWSLEKTGWQALYVSKERPIALVGLSLGTNGRPNSEPTVSGFKQANEFYKAVAEGYRQFDALPELYEISVVANVRLFLTVLRLASKHREYYVPIRAGRGENSVPTVLTLAKFRSLVESRVAAAHATMYRFKRLDQARREESVEYQPQAPASVPPTFGSQH